MKSSLQKMIPGAVCIMKSALYKQIFGAVCMGVVVSVAVIYCGGMIKMALDLENPITATVENGLDYQVCEDHVKITDCDESAEGKLVIPETIEGLPVTSIEGFAFSDCSSLTCITIPDGVAQIGMYAFSGCCSLTAIHVDSENQYYMDMDDVLFSKDQKTLLQYPIGKSDPSYSIPDGVTSIEDFAFSNCSSLTSVIIPDSVTSIGRDAFYNCLFLTPVAIPDSMINN
ncbi:MAG: leucine-rich repeat domain-containing protein [Oscillospiraceae bacterium]|nr:leucine-rich repeat domain-containing protein [Oscillospiraceae bacterium]